MLAFARLKTYGMRPNMTRSILTLGACLLLGGGALVETVQNRPALKDVFKDAFTIGTAINNAIASGQRRRVARPRPAALRQHHRRQRHEGGLHQSAAR